LIRKLRTIYENILKVYIHTCDRYIFHRSGGKLEVCLFTQKNCLYSKFILDLYISFLIYVDLVNKKLKGNYCFYSFPNSNNSCLAFSILLMLDFISCHREMESPSKKVAWGEAKVSMRRGKEKEVGRERERGEDRK
jgi:hypothetical protein